MPLRRSASGSLVALGLLAFSLAGCSKSTQCPSGQGSCTLGNQCVTECNEGCCVLNHLCHATSDCSGSTPVCDTSDGACVACEADTDCSSGQKCLDNKCVAPSACQSSADCSGATPACDTSTDTCVACLTTADCTSLFTVCQDEQCVQTPACTANEACSSDAPYCNTFTDRCGECFADSDCPSDPPNQGCYDGTCFVGQACDDDDACPAGAACAPFTTGDDLGWQLLCERGDTGGEKGGAACFPGTSTPCLSGMCGEIGPADGFCFDGCQTDADCAAGAQCPPVGAVFAELAGPDNVLGTDDDVFASVRICYPAACTSDAQCAGTGYDGATRVCAVKPGTLTGTSITADVLSWVTACLAPVGTQTGGESCGSNDDCASGECLFGADAGLGECFGACATSGDCADGGTCEASTLVDESGNFLKTCVE